MYGKLLIESFLNRRSENVRAQQQLIGRQKHDLSKWKYSELRDAINTSCDIELLEVNSFDFRFKQMCFNMWIRCPILGLSSWIPSPPEGLPCMESKEPQAHNNGWKWASTKKCNGSSHTLTVARTTETRNNLFNTSLFPYPILARQQQSKWIEWKSQWIECWFK